MNRKPRNAPAFSDVLSSLGASAPRAEPAASSRNDFSMRGEGMSPAAKPAPSVDVSWLAGAQARARAAQAAHFARAAETAEKPAPERPAAAQAPSPEPEPARADARAGANAPNDQAAGASSAEAPDAGPRRQEAGPKREGRRLNSVHAMRRLLAGAFRGFRRAPAQDAKPQAAPAPAKPAPAPRDEDAAIAAELGLRSDLAIDDLRRIRRDFAKKNHPDRFAPSLRGDAARRMTIANMLIDQQMKRGRPQK